MSTYISQKQHVPTGNEAVPDTGRFQVALHLVGHLVVSGCQFNDVTPPQNRPELSTEPHHIQLPGRHTLLICLQPGNQSCLWL